MRLYIVMRYSSGMYLWSIRKIIQEEYSIVIEDVPLDNGCAYTKWSAKKGIRKSIKLLNKSNKDDVVYRKVVDV